MSTYLCITHPRRLSASADRLSAHHRRRRVVTVTHLCPRAKRARADRWPCRRLDQELRPRYVWVLMLPIAPSVHRCYLEQVSPVSPSLSFFVFASQSPGVGLQHLRRAHRPARRHGVAPPARLLLRPRLLQNARLLLAPISTSLCCAGASPCTVTTLLWQLSGARHRQGLFRERVGADYARNRPRSEFDSWNVIPKRGCCRAQSLGG